MLRPGPVDCAPPGAADETSVDERFRMLLDTLSEVVIYHVAGVARWVSPSVVDLLGWTAEELTGHSTAHLWHPDDVAAVISLRDAVYAGELARLQGRGIFRARHKDGHYLWVDAALRIHESSTGQKGAVTSLREMTAQVEADLALAGSEARYRLLAENSTDVVYQTDVGGVIDWVSPAVAETLGWSTTSLVGQAAMELVHPADAIEVLALREDFYAGKPTGRGPIRYRTAAGDYRWMSVRAHPIFEFEGRVIGAVVGLRDVTEETVARQALVTSERQYRMLADRALDLVYRAGADRRVTWVAPTVAASLGWTPDDLVGTVMGDLAHPDDAAETAILRADLYSGAIATADLGPSRNFHLRMRTNSGDYRWMAGSATAVVDEDGRPDGVMTGLRDVHDETLARISLAASEKLFRSAIESASIGFAMTSLSGAFRMVNPALTRMLQRDESWLLERDMFALVPPEEHDDLRSDREMIIGGKVETMTRLLRMIRADGETLRVQRTAVLIRDHAGDPDYLLLQVVDVTLEFAAQEQLAYQAFHDSLTGIRNRSWILDILESDLRTARRTGLHVGVLFIDLDNFKLVNDSLGHAAGDEVLKVIAGRIAAALRPGDHVGRFGGDEFIVVIPDIRDAKEAELIAERICLQISCGLEVRTHRIVPTASIGIALSTPASTASSMLRDADAALFQAKNGGRARWHFFDQAMHTAAVARLTLEGEIRDGLERGEFAVHYQPIVSLTESRIDGYEALVRWEHPTRGLLRPADFLPVAEESGLIVEIGAQVLNDVCALLAARPDIPGRVGVNVSAVQIGRANWFARFIETLERYDIDPSRLAVEVTETAVLSLPTDTVTNLQAIRDLGIAILVDDFGTGFSSISLLRDLPVSGLKLDSRFVHDLTASDSVANALSAGLVGLASGLHLTTIAEGIENPLQEGVLRAQGWTHAQGYLYGRPGPL
jgi:diguanylate cyclase (GGDEF)-like protein/PAS domain S-box-containing protein